MDASQFSRKKTRKALSLYSKGSLSIEEYGLVLTGRAYIRNDILHVVEPKRTHKGRPFTEIRLTPIPD